MKCGDKRKHKGKKTREKQTSLHRHLYEQHIGHKLPKDYFVHHINHDKHDNRIENLELVHKSEHTRQHMNEVHDLKRQRILEAQRKLTSNLPHGQSDVLSKDP